ncbi:protein ABHD11-like [Ceratitis capitata]|uniref:protein ABHD11-like n=1 Tax=Ceratitis capitata TaxID=7213 RepID=UPI000C6C6639|nr:protein ABHD11-like [Ceratitis capitata]
MFAALISRNLKCINCYATTKFRSFSDVGPVKMSYTVYGENNTRNLPLFIMHGLLGSQRNWRALAKALEARTDKMIYTVDARNHGDSPHTSDLISAHMVMDAVELMKDRGIKKVCVMGHSMGGRTMMHFALKHPELVDRAIIIDMSPITLPQDFHLLEEICKAMESINIPAKYSLSEGRKLAEDQVKDSVGALVTVQYLIMNLKKRENGEFYWMPNLKVICKDFGLFKKFKDDIKYLPPYKGPVMFICGTQSNFIELSTWPDIQRMFPNAEIHWLDAGHLVHFDQPENFLDLVVEFLKR